MDTLERYNACVRRIAQLETIISRMEKDVEAVRDEVIGGEAMHSISTEGGGHGGGGISRPVENLAIRLADGWVPDTIAEYLNDIARLQSELSYMRGLTDRVDGWLASLNPWEAWVIRTHVIGKAGWKETVSAYRTEFQEAAVSKDTLKRILERGLEKILSTF